MCVVTVSSIPVPSSGAMLLLTHPSDRVFSKEDCILCLKTYTFGRSPVTLGKGLLLVMFSQLESTVFRPVAGVHAPVL